MQPEIKELVLSIPALQAEAKLDDVIGDEESLMSTLPRDLQEMVRAFVVHSCPKLKPTARR